MINCTIRIFHWGTNFNIIYIRPSGQLSVSIHCEVTGQVTNSENTWSHKFVLWFQRLPSTPHEANVGWYFTCELSYHGWHRYFSFTHICSVHIQDNFEIDDLPYLPTHVKLGDTLATTSQVNNRNSALSLLFTQAVLFSFVKHKWIWSSVFPSYSFWLSFLPFLMVYSSSKN